MLALARKSVQKRFELRVHWRVTCMLQFKPVIELADFVLDDIIDTVRGTEIVVCRQVAVNQNPMTT